MNDTMRVWDKVSKTNPANTKKVNQRGGFTSICAQSQIMEATREFGPIGEGWGYDAATPIFQDNLVFVPVVLWHGARENKFGPVIGGAEWKSDKGRVDSDAPKKATTDAVTKLLSQLGFNADVFLGLYDDNKYVAQVTREFAAEAEPAKSKPSAVADKTGPITDATRDWLAAQIEAHGLTVAEFCREFKINSLKSVNYEGLSDAREWLRINKKAA